MSTSAADFINVGAFAKAVARELKGTLDEVSPLKRLFNMEEAAIYCGMPVTSTLTAWKSSISIGECDERFGGQMSNKSLSEDD
jgi:hypothetical protein